MARWQPTKLGNVLQLKYGKPLPPGDRHLDGKYPAYGANGEKVRTNRFLCAEQTVIVGRKGSAGELTLSEEKFWPLDVTYYAEFDRSQHDVRFLYYLLLTKGLPRLARGVKPGINREEVHGLSALVPQLSEQRRIVAILDEALKAIAIANGNSASNLRSARLLTDGYLEAAFQQRPDTWTICPLADCLHLITYGFTNPMPTASAGPYMVTAKNVVDGRIDYASARRTSLEAFTNLLTDKSRPVPGDVLLTKDGTLGRLAVVDQSDLCINQSVALLRPNGRVLPHFLRLLLSSPTYQRRMVAEADGATIKHIYITRVDKMEIAFPAAISAQLEIIDKLNVISQEVRCLERLYQDKLIRYDALKDSLLHHAFTGQLTAKSTDKQLAEVV